jgi:hypothetical protein
MRLRAQHLGPPYKFLRGTVFREPDKILRFRSARRRDSYASDRSIDGRERTPQSDDSVLVKLCRWDQGNLTVLQVPKQLR